MSSHAMRIAATQRASLSRSFAARVSCIVNPERCVALSRLCHRHRQAYIREHMNMYNLCVCRRARRLRNDLRPGLGVGGVHTLAQKKEAVIVTRIRVCSRIHCARVCTPLLHNSSFIVTRARSSTSREREREQLDSDRRRHQKRHQQQAVRQQQQQQQQKDKAFYEKSHAINVQNAYTNSHTCMYIDVLERRNTHAHDDRTNEPARNARTHNDNPGVSWRAHARLLATRSTDHTERMNVG